ncbi:MAG: PAS domain-containing protein [Betaproteobacteria bacterium]|nr:PAS domain-containing protein [Betaproteobacteria bacterium]
MTADPPSFPEVPAARAPEPASPQAVVAVASSAGGLEPLRRLVAAIPPADPLAWVVFSHLDPAGGSMLVSLLQRATALPVVQAHDRMPLQAGRVHVIPPNAALLYESGCLRVVSPADLLDRHRPADRFCSSIARALGSRAVGVVLSGSGADGVAGLCAIRAAGGFTLAQDPADAQFDPMPSQAIAAGCVDLVALPQDMPARIPALLAAGAGPDRSPPEALDAVLRVLREGGNHDFSEYRTSTLQRRIERRMALHGLPRLADYAERLRGNPKERALLERELLIGVTGFFRDTPVWQALQAQVLPALIAEASPQRPLRAWVAGCSTGEEAYSLAIVLHELLHPVDAPPRAGAPPVQIFATDLSEDAIVRARRGLFPAAITREVSPARLQRHFTRAGDGWRIGKPVRESVVFATHDLLADPPFTRLDLISCRNLMIYLTLPLQERVLPLFHYGLRPGGVLLLGSSESVGRGAELFDPIDARLRLFRRRPTPAALPVPGLPLRPQDRPTASKETAVSDPDTPPVNLQSLADQMLLHELAPPAVLVSAAGDILYINGRTGRWLEPAAGKANWNLHAMARPGIREPLSAALTQAATQDEPVRLSGLTPTGDASALPVDVLVRRLREPAGLEGTLLVVFLAQPAGAALAALAPVAGAAPPSAGADAGQELTLSRERLRLMRDEVRSSREELQAANEELQSSNEELQSTNEELTSSKEELQAMNEELHAVNAELQSRVDELSLARSDMRNLLESLDVATLFLDADLNVRRYTEHGRRIFRLREGDIGRPIAELSGTLSYPELGADLAAVLRELVPREKAVPSRDGRWYSVRISPYRDDAGQARGALVTCLDITAAKLLEARVRGA